MAYTYSVLTGLKTVEGSIRNWINDSEVPAGAILAEAQAWLYERLRVREMMATAVLTFDADASSEALPADFLDPIEYKPYGFGDALAFVHEQKLNQSRDTDGSVFAGSPSQWTIIGGTAHLDVRCVEAFSGILMYYALPEPLAATDNETNFLTVRYPTLLRTVCTGLAFGFRKDENRKMSELAIAEKAIAEAAKTNDYFRRGQNVSR